MQYKPFDKFKTNSSIKKFKKILVRTLIGLLLFLLLLGIALSLPFVQTKIARYATNTLNEDFGTNIQIEKVAISIFGGVKLKGVLILDHHNDTLISADRIQTNVLSFRAITQSNLKFGNIKAEKLNFHMKTYKGEKTSNLDVFVKAFDNGKPGSGKFRLRAKDLEVTNGRYRLTNENAVTARVLDFKKLNGSLKDFYIKGSDVSADIQKLSLLDHRKLFVQNLKARFSYTKKNMGLEDLELITAESALQGSVKLSYGPGDMKDFVNRVKFDFNIEKAAVSSNELNYFYNEFGRNQKFYLSTRLKGPMNNFVLHDLKLLDAGQSEIIGTVNFRHLFDRQGPGFYMDGNFGRVTSDYANLKSIMPRILGKSLPAILEKFGRIDMVGNVVLTKKDITTDLYVLSEIGEAEVDLSVKDYNKPNEASYAGVIDLDSFDLGAITNQKTLGLATLHVEVNGSGFNQQSLNTVVKGDVEQFAFNNYNYTNIAIDGVFKWPLFEGSVESNDPNLRLSFDGLVDMSKNHKNYDFHAKIDYADLRMLNIVKKDTISILKGDLVLDATGNNLYDMAGTLQIKSLSYQNNRNTYAFEDFDIRSSFDEERVRTIAFNSKDIVEGSVRGIYDYKQLPQLFENALGSLYTNYSPHKVKAGQFLDFNFTIYNKIVDIFIPDVEVGDNTTVRGRINADKGEFVLAFDSPNVTAFNNYFSNIAIDVNNKNPLYNAYVSMDSIRMKNYKITDFSLINVTQNDTLYLRSEFKGGTEQKDFFNLNLYHTIDEDNRSVVGFKRSEINFKDYMWYINENDTRENKIVFNKKLTDFTIDKITMSHNDQMVELDGILRGKDFKDLRLSFNDVDLHKITPSLDSLNFGGRLNGEVSLKQDRQEFQPASSITIDSLRLNKYELGDLSLQVTGDRSFRKFNVNTFIEKNGDETFHAGGAVEIVDKQTLMSIDATLSGFDLAPLQIWLSTIFPEIRGKATGRAAIVGNVKKPEINGRLYLRDAGLKVGYLNTDYDFEENATVDINEKNIWFRNIAITDTKYKTTGRLDGSVQHDLFKKWGLDLRIESERLLVLDTQDSDEAMYYGQAFINGYATISGPTTALFIKAEAESAEGTDIKIPINNTAAAGSSATYIEFLSPEEKENIRKGVIVDNSRTYKGLEMEFDLDLTQDAHIEIIIDENTGHGLQAVGYGTLLLQINTLGKFNMWGDYSVLEGVYNFNFYNVISKRFILKRNGTINWEGDPTRARLNLEAVYNVQANPSILLENPTFNRNIPVEVGIVLTGTLTNPEHEYRLNFPNVSSVMKADLEYRLSDPTTREKNALSLISQRTFMSPTSSSFAAPAVFLDRAGDVFSGIFAEDESKVQVDFNYIQAERNPYVESSSQVGLTVSSQINDRITINGQLGVPVGGVAETSSAIVGNVNMEIRLNDENTLKGRVFNRESDIVFIGEGIGYTQGVGLSYEVDFNTLRELMQRIFGKKEEQETDTNTPNDIPDSDLSPEFIDFVESRNKKKADTEEKKPEPIPETD